MLSVSTIPEAITELKKRTGRQWTEAEIFDVAQAHRFELHARAPLTATTTIQVVSKDIPITVKEKTVLPPGHDALARILPASVAQLWICGVTETIHSGTGDEFQDEGTLRLFTEPVRITREDVRIRAATLKKIVALWDDAQVGKRQRYPGPEWLFSSMKNGQQQTQPPLNSAPPVVESFEPTDTVKTIHMPTGTVYVEYEKMMHLMAKALSDGEPVADVVYLARHEALEKELGNDVDSGALLVYDPLTRGRHSFPIGDALRTALVRVADFRALAAARGIDVIVKTAYEPTEADRAALRARIDEKEKYRASLSKNELRAYLDANGMSNVSLAPLPLDSVRSSGYHEPKKPPPIDWSHWLLMPQVSLWEAVALSVNLNPETLKFDKEGKDFQDRLRIALSHVAVGNLQLVTHYPKNEPVSPVLLAVFATWAVSQNIKIPSELAAMATAPLSKSNSDTLAFVTPMVNAGTSAPTTKIVADGMKALGKPQAVPIVDTGVSEQAAPIVANEIKKSALILKYESNWPTIERDLKDASQNRLSDTAKLPKKGFWNEELALQWARSLGGRTI